MNLFGIAVDRGLGWVILVVVGLLLLTAYMYVIRFLRRYATGMLAGFILLLTGLGLVLGTAFYLLGNEGIPAPYIWFSCLGIIAGCVSLLVGAFELTSFTDF